VATTNSTLSINSRTSNATFRSSCQSFSTMLNAVLPKTATSGQVNWSTANRTTNEETHFEVRYLDDSLHATRPVILKFNFFNNTQSVTNDSTHIRVQLFEGLDGGNNPTGLLGTFYFADIYQPTTAARSIPTYMCSLPGYFAMCMAPTSTDDNATGLLLFARTQTDAGVPTGQGITVIGRGAQGVSFSSNTRKTFAYRYDPSPEVITNVDDGAIRTSMVPFNLSNTDLPGGDLQYFRHFSAFPDVQPIKECLTLVGTTLGIGATFSATPVGITARTYLALPHHTTAFWSSSGNGSHFPAILWE